MLSLLTILDLINSKYKNNNKQLTIVTWQITAKASLLVIFFIKPFCQWVLLGLQDQFSIYHILHTTQSADGSCGW